MQIFKGNPELVKHDKFLIYTSFLDIIDILSWNYSLDEKDKLVQCLNLGERHNHNPGMSRNSNLLTRGGDNERLNI